MPLSLRLALCCLLALPLSAAGQDSSLPHAGTIEITHVPGAASFLPIETRPLKEGLCLGDFSHAGVGPIAPRGECDLMIQVPSGIDILYADTPVPARNGSWHVPVHFTALGPWKGSTSVDTACGLWEISLGLDPDSEQPVSTLVLTAPAESPGHGAFAGVIELAALYRFVNRSGGTSLEVPARLSLSLAGQWAIRPPGTPGLADSASNIALFNMSVQEEDQEELFPAPSCGVWSTTRCPVCLTAGPALP